MMLLLPFVVAFNPLGVTVGLIINSSFKDAYLLQNKINGGK